MRDLKKPVGLVGLLAGAMVVVTGCGPDGSGEADGPQEGGEVSATGIALPDEASHVHGAGVDPESGEVYVATHDGLHRIPAPDDAAGDAAEPEKVGPTIDLMGFSVVGPGRFVASGHPGPGTDMPNPVGLIESRDGGQSWEALSLEGESDFHALAAGEERTVGFDGRLRATEDGTTWQALDGSVEPFALAVSDDGGTVVATTQQGPQRSTDGGTRFDQVQDAPPLMLVDWVPGAETVFGVTQDGQVHRSEDAGATWSQTGSLEGEPQALHADPDQLVAVADHRVTRSSDEGATFHGW